MYASTDEVLNNKQVKMSWISLSWGLLAPWELTWSDFISLIHLVKILQMSYRGSERPVSHVAYVCTLNALIGQI